MATAATAPAQNVEVLRCPVCRLPITVQYDGLQIVKQDGRVMVGILGVVRCARKKCRGEWRTENTDLLDRCFEVLDALEPYIPKRG